MDRTKPSKEKKKLWPHKVASLSVHMCVCVDTPFLLFINMLPNNNNIAKDVINFYRFSCSCVDTEMKMVIILFNTAITSLQKSFQHYIHMIFLHMKYYDNNIHNPHCWSSLRVSMY